MLDQTEERTRPGRHTEAVERPREASSQRDRGMQRNAAAGDYLHRGQASSMVAPTSERMIEKRPKSGIEGPGNQDITQSKQSKEIAPAPALAIAPNEPEDTNPIFVTAPALAFALNEPEDTNPVGSSNPEQKSNGLQMPSWLKDFPTLFTSSNDFSAKCELLEEFVYIRLTVEDNFAAKNPSLSLLWYLLLEYYKHKGNLRSSSFRQHLIDCLQKGYFELQSLQLDEPKRFRLFPMLDRSLGETERSSFPEPVSTDNQEECFRKVEALLVDNNPKVAVLKACEYQQWTLALIIAYQVSPQAIRSVTKSYLKSTLSERHMVRTICELNHDIEPCLGLANDAESEGGKLMTEFRSLVISLLCVKTRSSLVVLKKLGDKIMKTTKDVYLSHICYLLSTMPLTFNPSSRLLLLGCHHKALLRTDEGSQEAMPGPSERLGHELEAIMMTEVFVQVMIVRRDMSRLRSKYKLTQPDSVAGSLADGHELESSISVAPSSIRTGKSFHTKTSRTFDRDRCINKFQVYRCHVVSYLVSGKAIKQASEYLANICTVLSKEFYTKRYLDESFFRTIQSHLMTFKGQVGRVTPASKMSDEMLRLLQDRLSGSHLRANLDFSSLDDSTSMANGFTSHNQSFQSDGLLDHSFASNAQNRPKSQFVGRQAAVQGGVDMNLIREETAVAKETVDKFYAGSYNNGGAKVAAGNAWTDPFAKPKPVGVGNGKRQRPSQTSGRTSSFSQQAGQPQSYVRHPSFSSEGSLDNSFPDQSRMMADAEGVPQIESGTVNPLPQEEGAVSRSRKSSNSIADPFAISKSRRESQVSSRSQRSNPPYSTQNYPEAPVPSSSAAPYQLQGSAGQLGHQGGLHRPPSHQTLKQPGFMQAPQAPQAMTAMDPQVAQPSMGPPGSAPKTFDKAKMQQASALQESFLGRVRNRLLRALVPVGDNAISVEKGLGSSLEGYYDENLKRWVFPNDTGGGGEEVGASAADNGPPVLAPTMPAPMNPAQRSGPAGKNRFRNKNKRRYVDPFKMQAGKKNP